MTISMLMNYIPRSPEYELIERMDQTLEIFSYLAQLEDQGIDILETWPGLIEELIDTGDQLIAAGVSVIEANGFQWDNERD